MWANFRVAFVGRLAMSFCFVQKYHMSSDLQFPAAAEANKGLASAFFARCFDCITAQWEFLLPKSRQVKSLDISMRYNLSSFKLRIWVAANLPWKRLKLLFWCLLLLQIEFAWQWYVHKHTRDVEHLFLVIRDYRWHIYVK